MVSQEIKRLYHIGSLLFATTNIYCLAIDIEKHKLVEVPPCHVENCFCQHISKRCGIPISTEHVYSKCVISTNMSKQVIYECPFGLSNIIVPVFQKQKCVAALQAGPILTMDPKEYLKEKILPIWNLKESAIAYLLEDLKKYPQGDTNYVIALSEMMSALVNPNHISNQAALNETRSFSFLVGNTDIGGFKLEDEEESKSELVNAVVEFIASNYSEDITLADAAKFTYVNPSQLSREFNKNMNCNFRSYLNNVRIEKAKELLATTDIPLADVGNQVGFADQSYFNKIFRKYEGLTPGQYRTLNHGGNTREKADTKQ